MLERNPKPIAGASGSEIASESSLRGRLLFALVVLLIALGIVLIGDHEIWFSSDKSTIEAEPQAAQQALATAPCSVNPTLNPTQSSPAPAKKQAATAKHSVQPTTAGPAVVATSRTVLPPLTIEVVAGEKHHTVHAGGNAANLEISTPESASKKTADNLAAATNAAERESMSAAVPPQSASLEPSYPLLAQHMNVQGSVVLQAIIGTDGIVQNLRVVSGPGILATAAQQAVREWRFKPVVENGQAVETKAKITVNFTINVADSAAKTTLAESRTDGILILSR